MSNKNELNEQVMQFSLEEELANMARWRAELARLDALKKERLAQPSVQPLSGQPPLPNTQSSFSEPLSSTGISLEFANTRELPKTTARRSYTNPISAPWLREK